jgi:hypothetical protein
MLSILNEAAEIAPVPFLKGTIGAALFLLQSARVSSLSPLFEDREGMLRLAAMAGELVVSIRAACDQPGRLESKDFRLAINDFTK